MARFTKPPFWVATDGAVMVEAALILPLLLALVFGVEEYGRLYLAQSTLQRAAYAASRCGAVNDVTNPDYPTCPDAGSINSYAQTQLWGLLDSASVTFTPVVGVCSTMTAGTLSTATVAVTATYTFNFLVNLNGLVNSTGNSTIPLSATAEYPLQC